MLSSQKPNITPFVQKAYLDYFQVKLRDQGKRWAPHKACKTCIETLRSWTQGQKVHLQFEILMIWRKQKTMLMIVIFAWLM